MRTVDAIQCLILAAAGRDSALREAFADIFADAGVQLVTIGDQVVPGASWVDAVYSLINTADLIMADVSDGNANVMYELGYAHASKKPTFLLMRDDLARIPAPLSGFIFYTYKPETLSDDGRLREAVRDWLYRFAPSVVRGR